MTNLIQTGITLTEDCLESLDILMEGINQYTHPPISRSELIEQLCWQSETLRETAMEAGWEISAERRKPGRPLPASTSDTTA